MASKQGNFLVEKSGWASIPGMQRVLHEAMATTFEIFVLHPDEQYARQAARAAFDELDRLEQELSLYVENSDIARINALPAYQPLPIGPAAFECLQLASRMYYETGGAFDVTIGSLLACWLNEDKTVRSPSPEELALAKGRTGMHLVKLDEKEQTVQLLSEAVQVDLGGIGKGYAIDRMAVLLREWSIDTALIHGGSSSVLALEGVLQDGQGWPVTLSNPDNRRETWARLSLRGQALSGSGLQKGRHIVDPRRGRPVEGKVAAWACVSAATSAAEGLDSPWAVVSEEGKTNTVSDPEVVDWKPVAAIADALTTAFIVMSPDEVRQYCSSNKEVRAMVAREREARRGKGREIMLFGPWKESDLIKQQ